MLGGDELCFGVEGDVAVPRYLGARDEVWLRSLMDELDAFVGRTVAELDAELPARVRELARAHRVSARALTGVRRILAQSWESAVVSAASPPLVRRAVFERAAGASSEEERAAAIDAAAAALDLSRESVLASLFADLPGARRLSAPAARPSPSDCVGRYNLALAQGILFRSEEVTVHVREHVRSVVRFAKLLRLLCTYAESARGTTLRVSGPLSLFRQTTKYGRALASFLPSLLSTPGWAIEARCVLGERRLRFLASASDPLARPHALPRATDSRVEERLLSDVRRLGSEWSISRESAAVPLPDGGVFFPDFTLARGEDRVLVELVGYYTPEYLASKLRALEAARDRRLVVLVDDALACEDGAITASAVLRYRRRPDAQALLLAAARVCSGRSVAPRA